MSDSKVPPTPPKLTPTRRAHAARPDSETVEDPDNALASSIGDFNQKIEPYTKPIAIAVVGLVVAGVAWTLYRSEQTGARSDATLQLIRAVDSGDPEVLDNVAGAYPDTVAAGWASVFRGDSLLASGLDDLFRDRESAAEQLEEAKTAYRDGLGIVGDRVLVARASLGLAKIAEAGGDMDDAVAAYQVVADNAESEQMRTFAEERMEYLQAPSSTEFVAWFAEQDFTPADPSLPPSLPGLPDLPDLPDLELPKLELPGGDNSSIDPDSDQGMKLPSDSTATDESGDAASEEAIADDGTTEVEPVGDMSDDKADEPSESSDDEVVEEVTSSEGELNSPATP